MREAVIVEALRTPIGRGKPVIGDLFGFHPAHLLAIAQRAVIEKAGVKPEEVEQLIGGCVTQAGEQAGNLCRNAWLSMGTSYVPGATTIDTQCGSAQQANHLISALVASGSINIGIACGVEVDEPRGPGRQRLQRSRASYSRRKLAVGFQPRPVRFSAQRIAKNRGITRERGRRNLALQLATPRRGRRRLPKVASIAKIIQRGRARSSVRTASPPARPRSALIATRDCAIPRWRRSPGLKP
jgi:acetyl-CoA C-acetyltransferase